MSERALELVQNHPGSPPRRKGRRRGLAVREAAPGTAGLVSVLRAVEERGQASWLRPLMKRRVRALQASHGNLYVQRVMRRAVRGVDSWGPVSAQVQRAPGPRVTATLVTGSVRRRSYRLGGSTLDDVADELSGRDEWGRGGAENIAYEYTANASGTATRVRITAVLFTELPVWPALRRQSAAVRREWNRMMAALRRHENRHVSIARTHLGQMRDAMKGQPEADLPGIYDDQIAALQEAQVEYDAATTNGQSEGVSLDLSVAPARE